MLFSKSFPHLEALVKKDLPQQLLPETLSAEARDLIWDPLNAELVFYNCPPTFPVAQVLPVMIKISNNPGIILSRKPQ